VRFGGGRVVSRLATAPRANDVVVAVFAIVTVGLVTWQSVEVVGFFDTPRPGFYIVAGLALLADTQPFRIGDESLQPAYVFISICFTFALLLLFGLAPALLVQFLASVIATIRLRLTFGEAVITVGRLLLALAAANLVLDLIGPTPFRIGVRIDPSFLVFVIGPALAWFATNYTILILSVRLRTGFSWRDLLARTFRYELLATGALLFLAPIFVGTPRGYVIGLVLVPVFALTQISRLLARQASGIRHEPLTGTLSARGLATEFSRLARGRPRGTRKIAIGLSVIRVEQAAEVRELFGRAFGDQMLKSASERATDAVGPDGVVGRIFGDELTVLTPGDRAIRVAHRVREAMLPPAYFDDLPFSLLGPVGVSIGSGDSTDLPGLVRDADEAARMARRTGLPVGVFEPRSAGEAAQRIALLKDVNQALLDPSRRDEIAMTYQPQVAVATGRFVSMEALLRWTSPSRGVVDAQQLIDYVEPTMLMRPLTYRVIDDVAAQLAAWAGNGIRISAAINVSVRDLMDETLVDRVLDTIRDVGIDHEQVRLEITEGALASDEARISRSVARLADARIAVSVDDFGTGYASLLYLRSLAVTEVKIDRGLVQRITVDPNDRTIVRSIVEMGQALGLTVIAEGVEDQATHDVLAELQCPEAQGFFYARPLSPTDVPSWLADNKRQPRFHGGAESH
jgi:EAL domain-containing protein (putative c-di-GMP-specific phosphodiesterase class I)